MFERWRHTIARWIAPSTRSRTRLQQRMYAMAKPSRLTSGWGQSANTSEDTELVTSLRLARSRSRELVRDAAYAKRAKIIVQNNVVGTGIGLQAQVETVRGALNDRINTDIESAWDRWGRAGSCHTGGSLHFSDLERAAIGQVFEAGEVFFRLHYRAFGDSAVPLALELIEAERLADEFQPSPPAPNTWIRMGVEADTFYRPVAYWIRSVHPGELRLTTDQTYRLERVPAEFILHLRLIDRWPQTRAIPWLHAAGRRLNDMDGLSEAEITAARAAACYMGFIETPDGVTQYGDTQQDGSQQVELEPAAVEHLAPGEKFNFAAPNRPNSSLDPFMRMMLREVAAGTGSSYESLSRDYSQSNYSSSRLALLDDRELWQVLQKWFIRAFREPLHRVWLRQAVLAKAIPSISVEAYAADLEKFEAVRFKPRGWSWVDPVKEVDAYREAIRSGFTTVSDVIALTGSGRDLEDVLKERRYELDRMAEANLIFDTDPAAVPVPPRPIAQDQPSQKPTDESATDQAAANKALDEEIDPAVAKAEQMLRGESSKG